MNRTFQRRPSEALKAILEKEINLESVEMDPFTPEDLRNNYSGRESKEQIEQRKKTLKIGQVSQMFTNQNIQMYQASDLFVTAMNNQVSSTETAL